MKKFKNLVYEGAFNRKSPFDLYLTDSPNENPLVVFVHGYKGFKDWGPWELMAGPIIEAGFDFLKFNFSHNGGTVENPIDFPDLAAFSENTFSRELIDLQRITDIAIKGISLEENIYRSWKSIVLIGHSRGGGISIIHASESPYVSRLITWASVADFSKRFSFDLKKWKEDGVAYVKNGRTKQDMPHKYEFYKDFVANQERLNIEKAAKSIQIPWLIVHGTEDETVPFSDAEDLKEWSPNAELLPIQGAGHTFGGKHPWEKSLKSRSLLMKLLNSSIEFF